MAVVQDLPKILHGLGLPAGVGLNHLHARFAPFASDITDVGNFNVRPLEKQAEQKAATAAHSDKTYNHLVACGRHPPWGYKPRHGKGRAKSTLNALLQELSSCGSRRHTLHLQNLSHLFRFFAKA
jgi:hypothetical protein